MTAKSELVTLSELRRNYVGPSRGMIQYSVALCDLLCLLTCGVITHTSYQVWLQQQAPVHLALHITFVILVMALFFRASLYNLKTLTTWPRAMGHLFSATVAGVVITFGLAFVLEISDPMLRDWLVASAVMGFIVLGSVRGLISIILVNFIDITRVQPNVAVIGFGSQANRFIRMTLNDDTIDHRLVGIFDERMEKGRIENSLQGFPFLGDLADLDRYVRKGYIQQVVIALPWDAEKRILTLVDRLRELPVDITLGYDLIASHFSDCCQKTVGDAYVLEIQRTPLSGTARVAKWFEDKILALVLSIALAPLMLVIALAIKLDSPGPVFFQQRRHGFNNRIISILKFRSMYHTESEQTFKQAMKDDPRVTRVGAFLRKTSLDELPQLFNVLGGNMSLVGPRPHPVKLNEQFSALVGGYFGRHNVRPGITGWAQVNGWRGETESVDKMKARVEHDLYYIEHWSPWLDCRILFMTLLTVFTGHHNAY